MNSVFVSIDLSKLPAPVAVEVIDFEAINDDMLIDLQARDTTFNALVESDPAVKVIEVGAYRETVLRQLINDKVKATMLAFAVDSDLDHRCASLAVPILRLEGETNDELRARAALSPEGYSVAGPVGAYKFFALSAHRNVKDAVPWNPGIGGRVNVAVLSKIGNGACFGARINHPAGYLDGAATIAVTDVLSPLSNGQELTFEGGAVFTLDADFAAGVTELTGLLAGSLIDGERAGILPFVQDVFDPETNIPLGDTVEVMSVDIVEYTIEAELTLYYGPDAETVRTNSIAGGQKYADTNHACARDITLSGLYAALHVDGVQKVNFISPAADIPIARNQASYCTSIKVTVVGRDE